ncbi:MAG: Arginine utilization protein RocB [Ktedonobacterales bacterium]|jgi:arginine utilization protein RocB|nr:MAG: Arginine utilization protein RocB [Ktedonobacterales bacterium]
MGQTGSTQPNWFEEVRRLTLALVRIRSVSPGEGEIAVAHEVLRLLHDSELEDTYTASGLDLIEHDALDRQNAYAFLRGQSARTIVLLGHIDTVGMQDYGILEPWASEPEALAERIDALATLAPELRADLSDHPGDWMFGRGVVDMKSGVAANIAVMRHYAKRARAGTPPPLSLVFLATPDEENESAGVLQAVRFLLRLRAEYGLEFMGAINTDYITSLYPGDPNWYVYTGTIGKLLPSFLVIGRESHVGDPFDGVDANLLAAELITDLSMSPDLCDTVRGQVAPPPVTLHATDLKDTYNVQLPFAAYFYLNVLTFTSGPADLLARLRVRVEAALERVLAKIDESERHWLAMAHEDERAKRVEPRTGIVLSYEELYERAVHVLGKQQVTAALDDEWERWPAALDKRERSLHLTHRLWQLSGKRGPAVIVYYSPPYYPSIAATPCALHEAVTKVIAAHPREHLALREYFPFLSDMSYLRLDAAADTPALAANMPVWRSPDAPARPGSYSLPLEAISELDMPVVDIGPYGRGAHQRGERLMMSRSFGMLPQLVYEVIEQLRG